MPDVPEPRFNVDVLVRVFGMDANGRPFSQSIHARNISDHGAGLSGLETELHPGDTIGVSCGDKKARCKVIWMRKDGAVQRANAGLRLLDGQACPWQREIEAQYAAGTLPDERKKPAARDKRRFPRHRVGFPVEIRDGTGASARMNTRTSDISGNGCYVQTMLPLPVSNALDITFWLGSRKVHTSAIVRTCDGGVGMGIEFTGLDEATQKQLQVHVEEMAAESSPFPDRSGGMLTPVFSESSKF